MSTGVSIGAEMVIAAAGGAGAVARYGLGLLAVHRAVVLTLLINIAGSLLLAWVIGTMALHGQETLLLVAAGFCGGFTTFSSFALQVHNVALQEPKVALQGPNQLHSTEHGALVEHRLLKASALVLLHICACLVAALLGWRLAAW
jgi:fluoride ion exporter CrcB/FEX